MGIQINGTTNNINAGIGSLSIEDIRELDIVGVATAANFKTGTSNVHSTGYECTNINASGIVTAASLDISGDIDFDGHTNLDNVSIAGVTTFSEDTKFIGALSGRDLQWDKSDNTLEFLDYTAAKFGTDNNLTIYHNAGNNNTYITESGVGSLLIGASDLYFQDVDSGTGHYYMICATGGRVQLNYDNANKLETTNTGVKITSSANGDGINILSGNNSSTIYIDANRSGANNGIGNIVGRWNGTTVAQMSFNTGSDTTDKNDGYIWFGTESAASNGNVNATERLRIKSGGQVCIGTDTEGLATYGEELTLGSSDHAGMTIRSGTGHKGTVYFSDATSGSAEYIGSLQYDHSDNSMRFRINGTDTLFINSSNNLKVPDGSQLQFGGSLNSGDGDLRLFHNGANSGIINSQGALYITNDATNSSDVHIRGKSSIKLHCPADGDVRILINSSGDIGFNDTSPTAHASGNNTVLSIKGKGSSYSGKIDFKDSSGNLDNYINSDNSIFQFNCDPNSQNGNTFMQFYVHGGERFRFGRHGQLGIGGANYGTSGQVLTSQGSGSAPQWASAAGNTQSSYVSAPTNNNNYNFSGIPSSAYRVIINYYNISSNSQSYLYSRVGHSGGYQTSGYKYIIGYHYYDVTDSTETDRSDRAPLFTTNWDSASYKWAGFQQFDKIYASGSQNAWLINTHTVENTGSGWQRLLFHGRGIVEMGSNTLDRVQLHTSSGNFDSGYIKVDYYT